jgi:hypothetical protein
MTTPRNRTSARQAAARQRIAQRDSPAGSDPPDESKTPKWIINPDRTAEKDLIVSMVEYLREDPMVNDNLDVFRFICRDWYTLERTLHTRTTIDTIKRRLLSLGIRYIYRHTDQNWYYWNDYTPLGMMDFYPAMTERTEPMSLPASTTEAAHDTPAASPEASPTHQHSMTQYPDLSPMDRKAHTSSEQHTLETMPIAPPRHSTSQSGAGNINLGSRSTDSVSSAEETTEDEVEYLGTQKPVLESDESDTSDEDVKPHAVAPRKYPFSSTALRDEEGFTPVLARNSRRTKKSQTPASMSPLDNTYMTTQQPTENTKMKPQRDLNMAAPPAEIQLRTQHDTVSHMGDHIRLPVQVDTVTEILQERLNEMTNQIEKREQKLIDKIQNTEDRLQKNERKAMQERQNHRNYLEKTMKRLEDWEENLLQREQTIQRQTMTMKTQCDKYSRRFDDIQHQAEKAINAWQEVMQTKMKEKVEAHAKEQMEKIEDFATNHEQQLMSLLDGYEEHARGIQAKLLTRLHADTNQTYKDRQSAQRRNTAIPVDEEDSPHPPSPPLPPSAATNDTVSPPEQAKFTRWPNVDSTEIMRTGNTPTGSHHHPTHTYHATSHPEDTTEARVYEHQHTAESTTGTIKYPAADYQQLARLRAATTPNQLRGRDRKSVCIFYNSFVDFNRIYRIPLKILDDVRLDRLDDEEENLYPSGLREQEPQLYEDYSSAIYARLEEDGVLDPNDPLYRGLLEVYNSRRDGYALLKGILAATVLVQAKDLGALSTPPQPQLG